MGDGHDDKNPFQVSLILDTLFKILSFEDVKKFRLVSSTWNEVGYKEISKRPQKPIKFDALDEIDEETLAELIQLQKSHNFLFPAYNHQLFSRFSISITPWMWHHKRINPIFELFFDLFEPSYVKIHDSQDMLYSTEICPTNILSKFLVKISSTVQEIDLKFNFKNKEKETELAIVDELAKTKFPNLSKISIDIPNNLLQIFFYPLIGQNSPKLNHLGFGLRPLFKGTYEDGNFDEEMKALQDNFKSTGLIPKLKFLDLFNVNTESLEIFVEYGERGLLKLTKLNYKNKESISDRDNHTEKHGHAKISRVQVFIRLIATQNKSLKILKISTPKQPAKYDLNPLPIRTSFPTLQNLKILQFDHFLNFKTSLEPINLPLVLPKLEDFRTFDIESFLTENSDQSADSIKSLSVVNRRRSNHFVKIYSTIACNFFPCLEFLEIDFDNLPSNKKIKENDFSFWRGLRKLRIHCTYGLSEFYKFGRDRDLGILKDVKKIEIMVDCGNTLALDDSYKSCLAGLMPYFASVDDLDHFRLDKLYQKCLRNMSTPLNCIIHLISISFIGYKISENFKRDMRSVFPDCNFVSCKFEISKKII